MIFELQLPFVIKKFCRFYDDNLLRQYK